MIASVQRPNVGRIVIEPIDSFEHRGTIVEVWVNDEGLPVVQILTPLDTNTHEALRVYVNDARATGWRFP